MFWPLQAKAMTSNTAPQIIEGARLEITLPEDNNHEASEQPTPYPIVLTASDAENDKLRWTINSPPKHGTAKIAGSNSVQTLNYMPKIHFHGTDQLSVQVSDIYNNTDTIDIVLFIEPVNDSPLMLREQTVEVAYGSPIQAFGLEKYFQDIDNENYELRYEILQNTHPDIVHPQIRIDTLELIYKHSGSTTVTVKVMDPEGLHATTHFYITVNPVDSDIKLLRSFPPLSQSNQPVVLFFQVSSASAINPTGLVTVSSDTQSCHYKLQPRDRGKGLCRLTLQEYQDHIFHAEYVGDNNFNPSSTQQAFVHSVRPKVLIYHTKPRKEYELSEDGMGDSYAVSLSQQPTQLVELTLSPNEQLSINGAKAGESVTFNLEGTQPVNVFIIPTDDNLVEGSHYGEIRHLTRSQDRDFHQLTSNLKFPIQDNDAGIVIKQTDGYSQLIEEETTDNYAIYLSTLPQKPVNIKIESYDNQAMVYPRNLLFDPETWYQAQNVQISAIPDTELEEEEYTASLLHIVRTQDTIYANDDLMFSLDGENTDTLDVSIIDNDAEQPPLAPSEFTAKVLEDNQVLLQWQDNSDNERHFILRRDKLKVASLPENTRIYQDIEVRCGETYDYEVFGVNKKGRSLKFATLSVQTAPCTELKPPDNLVAFLFNNQYINLIWNDTNNSEAGYIIERNKKQIGKTSAHTVGYRDNNFSCSMVYNYAVRAYGFDGERSSANYATVRTQACKGRFTLTLKIQGQGTVNGCNDECAQVYPEKQHLNFKARPEDGWKFDRWEGECNLEHPLVMNADQTCTAYFVQN